MINLILGEIIKHGDVKCIIHEGMPHYKNPLEKGRLIVIFKVKFPESGSLSADKLKKLEKLLPPREKPANSEGGEECILQDYHAQTDGNRRQAFGGDDDEDEEGGGGQRVQCATH